MLKTDASADGIGHDKAAQNVESDPESIQSACHQNYNMKIYLAFNKLYLKPSQGGLVYIFCTKRLKEPTCIIFISKVLEV